MRTWTRWQDVGTILLGIVIFATPFIFEATAVTAAAWTAYIVGVLLVGAGLWSATLEEPMPAIEVAPLAIGCSFTRGAVCPTNGKGTTAGSTRKLLANLYCTRKSTLAGTVPIPWLTRSKLNCRPRTPEISTLVSALRSVRAFTNTSSGSRSECST